jgi:predicted nucleic acid-binding protein
VIRAVIDSSAWIRARRSPPEVARRISAASRDGHLALCEPVRLELLRGARSGLDAVELDAALGTMVTLPADDVVWRLARRTLVQLAHLPGGRHRGPSFAAIVVAAVAERHEVAVLHDDVHFELIAEVTGQRVARVAGEESR